MQNKTIFLLAALGVVSLFSSCAGFDEQQYVDGTMNEVNKTHTGWMDHYWTDENSTGKKGGYDYSNEPYDGPRRRPY